MISVVKLRMPSEDTECSQASSSFMEAKWPWEWVEAKAPSRELPQVWSNAHTPNKKEKVSFRNSEFGNVSLQPCAFID